MKYPNFFIVGTSRAGTTFLYEILRRVPGIYMPHIKEPTYFARNVVAVRKKAKERYFTQQEYLSLFKTNGEKVIGEASTAYLFDPSSPSAIKEHISDAKIIISLRNPIERAYSEYLLIKKQTGLTLSFEECLKKELTYLELLTDNFELFYSRVPVPAIAKSLYYKNVNRYLELFDDVYILIFEEWIKEPTKHLNLLLEFLGIDIDEEQLNSLVYNVKTYNSSTNNTFILYLVSSKIITNLYYNLPPSLQSSIRNIYNTLLELNIGKKEQKERMSETTRSFLRDIFSEDIKKTEGLINRKLPWL